MNKQQAMTKSRCSKGFNLRLRAVFCCAILLFADLERVGGAGIIAGGEVIMAGGEVTMAGGEVTTAVGEAVMAGGEVIIAGGEAIIADPTSGPLHALTNYGEHCSQHTVLNN